MRCYIREPPEEDLDNNILRKVGTNIDDKLVERTRVLTWSKTMGKTGHISGSGHGKQQITFKAQLFAPEIWKLISTLTNILIHLLKSKFEYI